MDCPQCAAPNLESANFCASCGASLAPHCAHCGATIPDQANFCPNCGREATSRPAVLDKAGSGGAKQRGLFTGERRVVTVMFADISGFTAMSEHSDPEQIRNLMNRCFDHLVPVIERYGGVVDKFMGDGIMVLFGAPIAHEDDTSRALRASLGLMDALASFNAQQNTNLELHAGINTGLVVAGGIGSQGRQSYSVMGDTVNLAARLEDASGSGQILVGPDTYRLAEPLFDFEALPPIQVKGKSKPVQIYRLNGARAEAGPVRGIAGLSSEMVGRDAELAALLALTDAVRAGLGRATLVMGEPGLGKSRLLAEWRMMAQADAAGPSSQVSLHWATGQCLSYGQGLAYHLLTDLLRALLGVPAAAGERETMAALLSLADELFGGRADSDISPLDVYPYLGHLLSLQLGGEALARVDSLDPPALQALYLAATRNLLIAMARRRPLVLVCEDIHWADPSSAELLSKLLSLISEAPLLFCFTSRVERDVPGWRLITAARQQLGESLTELSLSRLSADDSQQLIANLLEVEALPNDIRAVILERAEGNPLFVEEVIRMLVDRGSLVEEDGRWLVRGEIKTVDIPDTLQSLLMARIDRLPEEVKHTLRVASVIGRQFGVRLLEEVLNAV